MKTLSSLTLLIGVVLLLLWSDETEGKRRSNKIVARWGDKKGGRRHAKIVRKGQVSDDGTESSGSRSDSGHSSNSDSGAGDDSGGKKRTIGSSDKRPYVTKETFNTAGGTKTIFEMLQEDVRYAEFAKLAKSQSEVASILNDGSRKLTLLVPSNVAIRNRGAFSDAARLLIILLYHVVEGTFSREELRNGSVRELPTCFIEDAGVFAKLPGGVPQMIAVRDGLLTTGVQPDAKILVEEPAVAKNGLIYQTDVMLIPPLMTPEGLEGTPYTETLGELLDRVYRRVGLSLFLPASGGPWPAGMGEQMIYGHAVEGRPIYWGNLWDGLQMTALDGSTLLVSLVGEQFKVNNRRIVRANIPTMFGVVHLLEGPLETPSANKLKRGAKKSPSKGEPSSNGGERYVPRGEASDKADGPKDISDKAANNDPANPPVVEARKEAAKQKEGNGSMTTQRNFVLTLITATLGIMGAFAL